MTALLNAFAGCVSSSSAIGGATLTSKASIEECKYKGSCWCHCRVFCDVAKPFRPAKTKMSSPFIRRRVSQACQVTLAKMYGCLFVTFYLTRVTGTVAS